MTGREVRTIRETLGMTQRELGAVLRLADDEGRTVRNWESDRRPISGPASLALEALASGWRPAGG